MGLRRRSCEKQSPNNKIQILRINMDSLLQKAIRAAIDAGKKILDIYELSDFKIETKIDNTPLTIADKTAHDIITEQLKGEFPILSEEGKSIPWEIRKEWDSFWLVDPLDGTKEFIKRNGEFTVNIAFIEKGNPLIGVIFIPVLGELYYADKNGSFKCSINLNEENTIDDLNQGSIKLPNEKSGAHYIVVGSRSHLNVETEEFIKNIITEGKPLKMVSKGSSLKLCLIASGEADIYPRLGPTMEWDIAAGHAIALFAGRSVVQYPSGEPMVYNKQNLLNPWFVVK
jgi:3'(2'), 5'-bisphosphate nucleotidase